MITRPPELPLGITTFRTVREKGMVYVDKTSLIHSLVRSFTRVFLARPPGFGKSLLISTLESYFSGERHLFEGLSLNPSQLPQPLPVIKIDLSTVRRDLPISTALEEMVCAVGEEMGVAIENSSATEALSFLIRSVARKSGCVVLIDNYDKPLAELLSQPELFQKNLRSLQNFCSVLKAEDRHIHYLFVTGISRFSNDSIFSGMNNLKDITLHPDYASICGFTEEEVESSFSGWLDGLGSDLQISKRALITKLRDYYSGYRFTREEATLFNPSAVLKCFFHRKVENYPLEAHLSSGIAAKIAERGQEELEDLELQDLVPNCRGYSLTDILFQMGYLTIKKAEEDRIGTSYTLGWTNDEVRRAFFEYYLRNTSPGVNLP